MAEKARMTDKDMGIAALLSLIAFGGALVMYLGAGEPLSGWGFALATVAGAIAVVAIHVW